MECSASALTAVWLAHPGQAQLSALKEQLPRTDKEAAELRESASSTALKWAADDDLQRRVDEMLSLLDQLGALRKSVEGRSVIRTQAVASYTSTIDSIFRMYDAMGTLDDKKVAKDTGNLIELNRSWKSSPRRTR